MPAPALPELEPDLLTPTSTPSSTPTNSPVRASDGSYIVVRVFEPFGQTQQGQPVVMCFEPETTFEALFAQVSEKFGVPVADFELTYQDAKELYELSTFPKDLALTAANMSPNKIKQYGLSMSVRSKKKKSVARNLSPEFDDVTTGNSGDSEAHCSPGSSTSLRKSYCGLRNTTMTCYLNSALQGFWFTPEFRNLIYTFEYTQDEAKKTKSICLPLQKLFLKLQFSKREAIDTDELIRTFGWSDRDTWQQHDVQELWLVLMDMLKEEFRSTPQYEMISKIYYGELIDYIECQECNNGGHRSEEFLVLPVSITKPDGQQMENATLEESLKQFVTPEVLDGSNQYACEKCNKKVDAHKGYFIKTLPRIFGIQLKRFECDWRRGQRTKLNNPLVFPIVLNMNSFIAKDSVSSDASKMNGENAKAYPNLDMIMSKVPQPRQEHSRPEVSVDFEPSPGPSTPENDELDFNSSKDAVKRKLQLLNEKDGPDVYELYAIFVHRGGLSGGHYFAYIRDLETYSWLRCDDSSIRSATIEELQVTFGVEGDRDQASAYMLLYRRYDEVEILPFMRTDLPHHIMSTWDSLMEEDTKVKDSEMMQKNTIRMLVKHRKLDTDTVVSSEMSIPKCLTTGDVASYLFEEIFKDDAAESSMPPKDCLRIVRFDAELNVIENSFPDYTQYLTYSLRHPLPQTKKEALLLEEKDPDQSFEEYHQNDFIFITSLLDSLSHDRFRFREFHHNPDGTVFDLLKHISSHWNLDAEKTIISLNLMDPTSYFHEINVLKNLDQPLSEFVVNRIAQIFVTQFSDTDLEHADISRWEAELAERVNRVVFDILDIDPPILERWDKAITNVTLLHSNCRGPQSDSDQDSSIDSTTDVNCFLNTEDANNHYLQVQLDRRLPVRALSHALSGILKTRESEFVLLYTHDGDDLEILNYDANVLAFVAPGGAFKFRSFQRLKEREGRVYISILDFNNLDLFSALIGTSVLHPEMTEAEAKAVIFADCASALTGVNLDRCRLRRKCNMDRVSKIFRPECTVNEWIVRLHESDVLIQIYPDTPPEIGQDVFGIMYRVWHPSTWELESPKELYIEYDHSIPSHWVLRDKLLEAFNLPLESANELQWAKVEAPFPCNLNPLAAESLTWTDCGSPPIKSVYFYGDDLIVFVRFKSEKLKEWTPEEKRRFEKENDSDLYVSSPRREKGITINLNAMMPPP